MTIKIDFHVGTHGHFLEYVSNVYIMQTRPSLRDIFKPPTYSAHNPDKNYLDNRVIICGHFSSKNNLTKDDVVIRISTPTSDNMFFVAVTNFMYKTGDIGFEKQLLSIPMGVRAVPAEHRNDWYSKFSERDQYVVYNNEFIPVESAFEFPFESFFSFNKFCIALTNLATFLNQTFFPDQSLYNLWSRFIQVNQGWQSYTKCDRILNDIFANTDSEINCTIIEQAWLNFNLSKMCRIYQGPMFDDDAYPLNTQTVYRSIQDHLKHLGRAS